MGQEDHAVVIGISDYPHLNSLRGPTHDVAAVVEWLRDPSGGDVPETQIHVLSSETHADPARPSSDDVYDAFRSTLDLAEDRAPDPAGRRLYIFMAGHGFGPTLREAALLVANTERKTLRRNVSGSRVADFFGKARYFSEIVLLMDCCRENLEKVPAGPLPWDPVSRAGKRPRRLYAYAAGDSELARERLHDGRVRGIFTVALLDALQVGASSPSRLRELIKKRMIEMMGRDHYVEPDFESSEPEIELGAPVQLPTLTLTLTNADRPVLVTVHAGPLDDQPVASATLAPGGSASFSLPPNLYEIRRDDGKKPDTLSLGASDVERTI